MAATKITDLAKEWGLETKDLLSRLEKIGIRNRKAPNSLSDDEIQRASQELGLGEKRGVTIGEERVVTSAGGEAMVERRVGSKVIRRRSAAGPAPELVLTEPIEPLSTSADILSTMGSAEPMLESFEPEIPSHVEIPEPSIAEVAAAEPVAETPVIEEPVVVAPVAPVIPTATVPKPALTAPPAPAPLTSTLTPPRPTGPRVLGRIDLKRVEPPRPAVTTERPGSTDATRARRPPGETADPAATTTSLAPGKKKTKKRVIEKPEISEAAERDTRSRGMARKKRAMPGKEQRKTEITTPKASKRIVRISELITVGDLAKAMGVKVAEVVKKLMEQGMMATVNQTLDADTATLIASEFGYNVENVSFDADSAIEVGHEPKTEEALLPRPPVITIMGHVDHGKTSLLDAIRQTNVTDQEAGGITQHIGAYMVDVGGKRVTFLDTPGHEAFTAMRARGAKVTDLVVLVVAADDGVMPQTIEAINHARAAKVPIVVAINKIDKPESNLDRIKQELANHGLVPEEWGGDTITAPVSAKTKDGVPHLLEMLLLQAEVLELKANHEKPARGTIIEAKLDRGRGPVATVLVQEGTLKTGDPFVCGAHFGRVRAMIDDHGKRVTTADPSTPVEILGLGAVPEAGASFVVVADEAMARQVADHRQTKLRESSLLKTAKVTLEDLYRQIQAGDTKELRVVIKADVQGSAGALSDALTRLSTDEVRLNVIHSSVGGITESDVMLASASNAVVIGFNIRPEAKANQAAEREGVDIRLYTIIYDALNEIRDAMEGLLDPTFREKVVGRAEVREVFSIPNIGNIAGSFVTDGKITRNASARLVRDHVVVHESRVSSLRRFKDDAREVQSGYECGIGLENYNDLKAGDVIEVFEKEQVARRLGPESGRAAAADRA